MLSDVARVVGASSRVLRIADLDERISVENATVMALAKKRRLGELITPITRFCLTPGEPGRKGGIAATRCPFCLSESLGALCCPECQTGPVSSDWEDMWMTLGFTKGPRTRHIRRVPHPERERAELPKATTNGFLKFSGSTCAVRSRRGPNSSYALVRSSDVRNTCLFQITYPVVSLRNKSRGENCRHTLEKGP